jgi:hypothetical protein
MACSSHSELRSDLRGNRQDIKVAAVHIERLRETSKRRMSECRMRLCMLE